MKETKTIREWLEELEEPYKSQAIQNAENESEYNDYLDEARDSLAGAVLGAFTWEYSPEGDKYWSDLYDTLY